MANYANKKEFRKALLYALGVEKSLAEVDKEEFREGILQGLNASYTAEDLNVKDKFRAKLVEAVAEAMAGGGDSDFSTAEVKVINSTGSTRGFGCPNIYTEGSTDALVMDGSVGKNTDTTITAVLYKGKVELFLDSSGASMTATGDIEISDSAAIISGDGTITISAS